MDFSSSHYPISDIKEWRDTNKLEIRPDFQRKAVWSLIAQKMLIDTIIKKIPMPKIYLESKMKNVVKSYFYCNYIKNCQVKYISRGL